MKKVISLALSLIMLVSIGSFSVTAYAKEGSAILNVQKMKYEAPARMLGASSVKKVYNGTTYYGDGYELYCKVRDAMDARKPSFVINYYNSNSYMSSRALEGKIVDMIEAAWTDEMSVTSTDGDYIRWSLAEADYDYKSPKSGYYRLTLKLGYYTTASEEKQVDKEVNSIVSNIRKKNWSDYNILKYIHDEICSRTTYDDAAVRNPYRHYHAYAAYGALVGGEVVCQGYALAFYRICRELGYDVRFVYSDDYGNHAWNMIILDGRSYFVDCTWDDEIIDEGGWDDEPTVGDNNYYYFLADYPTMRSMDGDGYYDRAHLLDTELTDDSSFVKKYLNILTDSNFDPTDASKLSNCSKSISYSLATYSASAKTPSVTIKDINGKSLVKGEDYTVSYSKNTNCGRAVVNINGIGDYAGMTARRTFVIKPSAMSKPVLAPDGRTKNSIELELQNPGGSVTGYQIQIYRNGKWESVLTTTSSTKLVCLVENLTSCKRYQFRVRAYKAVAKVNYYGEASSSYTTYTSPRTPTNLTLSTKSSRITARWDSVTCTGYEIKYSRNSDMSNAKTVKASSTATSKTISSLSKGKKYYVRIRSYYKATINGKSYTYYSPWGTKKSITVK